MVKARLPIFNDFGKICDHKTVVCDEIMQVNENTVLSEEWSRGLVILSEDYDDGSAVLMNCVLKNMVEVEDEV